MKTYIREWRLHRGYSQTELADLIGKKDPNIVSRWEREVYPVKTDDVAKIADALVCTPYDILFRDPNDEIDLFQLWADASAEQRDLMIKLFATFGEKSNTKSA